MMDQQNLEGYAARFRRSFPGAGQSARAMAEKAARETRSCRQDFRRRTRPGTGPEARRSEQIDHSTGQARQELFLCPGQRLARPRRPHHPSAACDGGAAGLYRGALRARSHLASAGGRPRRRRPAAIPLPCRLGKRSASIARRTGWPSWSGRCRKSAATSRRRWPATRRPANSRWPP